MDAYIAARLALKEIIANDVLFSTALKKALTEYPLPPEDESFMRALVSCELHHHLLLSRLVSDSNLPFSADDRFMVLLVLSNILFLKRRPVAESMDFLVHEVCPAGSPIEESALRGFVSSLGDAAMVMPKSIPEDSETYLSLKYNTPEWLIRMWKKHYGQPVTLKILSANTRPVVPACRVNTLVTTRDEILKDSDFVAGPIEDTVVYRGQSPLKKKRQYLECQVFQQRFGVTHIIDSLHFEARQNVLIYEERPNAVYIEIAVCGKNEVVLNVAANSMERRLDIRKAARDYNIQNIEVFESTPNLLVTHVSTPMDCVIYIADCSKFDLIRSLPDFFIHFRQSNLDALIAKQNASIEECAQLVAPGGRLCYAVNTINNKESHQLMNDFLARHPDYTLENERQYLPFDQFNMALYFAVLRKAVPEV